MQENKNNSYEYIKQCINGEKEFYEVRDEIDVEELNTQELHDFVDYLKGYYEPDISSLYVRNKAGNYDDIDYSRISETDKKDKFFLLALTKGISDTNMEKFTENVENVVKDDSSTKVSMAIVNNNIMNNLEFSADECTKIASKEPYVFDNLDVAKYATKIDWKSPLFDWSNTTKVKGIVEIFGKEFVPQEIVNNNVQNNIEKISADKTLEPEKEVNKSVYSDYISNQGIYENKVSLHKANMSKRKYIEFLEQELSLARADLKTLEEQTKGGSDKDER